MKCRKGFCPGWLTPFQRASRNWSIVNREQGSFSVGSFRNPVWAHLINIMWVKWHVNARWRLAFNVVYFVLVRYWGQWDWSCMLNVSVVSNGETDTGGQLIFISFSHFSPCLFIPEPPWFCPFLVFDSSPKHPTVCFAQPQNLLGAFLNKFCSVTHLLF